MELYLDLLNIETMKTFRKYFKCENDKYKFINKLKYSKKILIVGFQKLYY